MYFVRSFGEEYHVTDPGYCRLENGLLSIDNHLHNYLASRLVFKGQYSELGSIFKFFAHYFSEYGHETYLSVGGQYMTIPQDLLSNSDVNAPETLDEFVTGRSSSVRLLAVRLVSGLFSPPYFPTEMIWLLLALIASTLAVELLPQPASYWVDPSTSSYYSFLAVPLKWGVWSIGIHAAFMLLVSSALFLFNKKPAFILWVGLAIYHLLSFSDSFRCGSTYFFFETSENCSEWHSSILILAGILWGFLLLIIARFGLIAWIKSNQEIPDATLPWRRNLRIFSGSWITLLGAAVAFTAFVAPKPEWRPLHSAHIPPGRTEAALAYDSQRAVAVLFGGTSSWTPTTAWKTINDTWEWNGNDWIPLNPKHSPSPRFAAGMAFDETRGVTVLFGGSGQDEFHQPTFNGDTWEWNGQDWLEVSPTQSPPARQALGMYFDPIRGTVVLYGGYYIDAKTRATVFLDDAWAWDGKSWQPIAFDQPRRSSSGAMVFDPDRQLPILMDGEGLWLWQDGLWNQPNFSTSPPGRWGSELIYDPKHQKIVLMGGFKDKDVFGDTWLYDGKIWQQVATAGQPPVRNGHNLFYDHTRGTVVLFGGLNSSTFYNDMWELALP